MGKQRQRQNSWQTRYDEEADVLHISFRKPQRAARTIEVDEDILLRKDGPTVVVLTILNAKARGD